MEPLNLTGIILRLAYRLRRHLLAGWPLSRWLGLLLVVAGLAAWISWWPNFWPAMLLGILYLAYVAILAWAARRRYVHFEVAPDADALLNSGTVASPLRKEEMVPVRASGLFSVEGQERYYVDIEADFETVGTREHIVLGRSHPSRFLLVGHWPIDEWGWWYIFFEPATIREVTAGHLIFGPQPQLALRVVYAPDEGTQEAIYLAFAEASTLRRVWDDLLKEVRK